MQTEQDLFEEMDVECWACCVVTEKECEDAWGHAWQGFYVGQRVRTVEDGRQAMEQWALYPDGERVLVFDNWDYPPETKDARRVERRDVGVELGEEYLTWGEAFDDVGETFLAGPDRSQEMEVIHG